MSDAPFPAMTVHGHAALAELPGLLERMQTARSGSPELDARIDCLLNLRLFDGMADACRYHWRDHARALHDDAPREAIPEAHWSEDLTASLRLLPEDCNFSTGLRDGVCWAWIQPNDHWTPGAHELRHDHPCGSGLVVAYTMALALTAAAVIMADVLRQRPGTGDDTMQAAAA